MTHLGYLLVGWGVSLGCGVLYAARLVLRGRDLSARVPAEHRRWMTSDVGAGSAAESAAPDQGAGS